MLKRGFDIFFSFLGLILLLPIFLIISFLVLITSRGGIFYFQNRVGKNNRDFKLVKFRTMYLNSDKKGLLTVGSRDARITPIGYYLRKYKLDELPQLLNVFFGTMSLVGPRPEVRKYVDLYSAEQQKVLEVKPGITDYASLEYFNENELLSQSSDPDGTYVNVIMPAKLELNKRYIFEAGCITDFKIIFRTIKKIIF